MSRRAWAKWADQQPTRVAATSPDISHLRVVRPETVSERSDRRVREIAEVATADLAVPHVQHVDIVPVPKPRMTRSDRWNKRPCVLRYRAYVDELQLRGAKLSSRYRLEFVLPMPASWSEELKSEMDGKPHLVRPDTSNLVKAVEDALVPRDERLHDIAATKVWGRKGSVRILRVV